MSTGQHRRPHPRLDVTRNGPLLTVTLDAPERHNAQVPSLWRALADLGVDLPDDIRVVLFRGNGPSFSSGLERDMLTSRGVEGEPRLIPREVYESHDLVDRIASYQKGFTVWSECSAITVAAVQGRAIGAGLQLALACDLRVLADDARLSMPEATLGLVPDLGGTRSLVRAVGYSRALEICLTGRPLSAREAVSWGLASLAVPAAELDDAALDLVDTVLDIPPAAALELKRLLRSAETGTFAQQLYAERTAQARLLSRMAPGHDGGAG